ncbi:MAG: hypothetical protein K0Q94_1659 [Paenibacillus sp.]|nr:hypothetical protein [Paenibacillus sp.]
MKAAKWGIAGLALFVLLGILVWLKPGMADTGRSMSGADNPEEKLSLHFFISGAPGSHLPPPEDDFIRQAIEAKFNIDLTVTAMPPGDEYNATLASLLAANNPPDMWLNISPDGGAKYTLDNVLADMTYFVTPATMPNYFQYWMSEQELREYQVHNKFARAPIPYDKKTYRAYYIRRDWLSRLGLDVPQTYDQYVNVLHAFTYKDPDGNGVNDTYGFTTAGAGTGISMDWPEYVKNGLLFPAYFENDKLIDMQTDLRVGQVVEDILKIQDAGLVDPDWFLYKDNQHVDKAVQGKAGIVLGDTLEFALDSNPESLQTKSRAIDPNADWVPFNPFGNQPLRTAAAPGYPFVFSNNAAGLNQEKLKVTVQILDWLAGEEGFLLTHYGIREQHYKRDGNTITLLPGMLRNEDNAIQDLLNIWSFFTPNTPEILGLAIEDPRITARDRTVIRTITSIPVYEGLGTTLTPPLGINVEKMRARQNELQLKMLLQDKSGKRWPEYRGELMSSYEGESIFQQYEEKIRAARKNR